MQFIDNLMRKLRGGGTAGQYENTPPKSQPPQAGHVPESTEVPSAATMYKGPARTGTSPAVREQRRQKAARRINRRIAA